MAISKLGAALTAFACLPLVGIAIVYVPGMVASVATGAAEDRRGSESYRRDLILAEITKAFVAQGKSVTPAMRAGQQFAPSDFINDRLEASGAKWRVKSVDGITAKMIDVS